MIAGARGSRQTRATSKAALQILIVRMSSKGDYPVIGQHTFMNITLATETTFVMRRLPVPQDVSSVNPGSFEFFGRGRQEIVNQNFVFGLDLFHGETSFKPVDWRFKVTGVTNINYLRARENGIVNIDVRKGTDRTDNFSAVEDLFFEVRLGDTTKLLPFLRGDGSKAGRSPYFDSTVAAGRFAGIHQRLSWLHLQRCQSRRADLWQLRFESMAVQSRVLRHARKGYQQRIEHYQLPSSFVSGIKKSTSPTFIGRTPLSKAYTTQFSLHYNDDRPSQQFDVNGFPVRPAKIGTIRQHHVQAGYLGWAGDGHVGRFNVTHAFYQVFGRDDFNQLAGRATHINAQMARG
jgi:hypothetical protein